jgi:choline transporter-like protein 2/4/5
MDNRGCTDILCCVLFIAWIVAMAAISIYSFANGSTDKLAYKYDMSG